MTHIGQSQLLLYDIDVLADLVIEIFFPGEFFQGIAFRLELFEFALHLGDLPLVEFDLPLLPPECHARTDHLSHVVGVEEADPDQENEAHDEVLVEQYFPGGMLFPFPVFFPDFGEDGHRGRTFHKNNDYF